MAAKAWGNAYRAATVCVDSYEKGNLAGRLFHPYLETGQPFESLTQFLLLMEQILNQMNCPQSFVAVRTFTEEPHLRPETEGMEFRRGQAATFVVKILFRQNASWQGSIAWQEGGREESFRSVLELILLMDSAMSSRKEQAS